MMPLLPPLWAVHISDGQLTPAWCVGGYVAASVLALLGAWRIRDEEIPQLAVLTAAFFLTALIHVPVPLGPKTHLLLSGLLGVVLGRRAILAVLVGLFLQSALSVMEGVGFTTLGVNACVMTLPAYFAWGLFAGLSRVPWVRAPFFRAGLIGFSSLVFVLSAVYTVAALVANWGSQASPQNLDLASANYLTFHPATLAVAVLVAAVAAWVERRLDHPVEFPVGVLVGELSVLATILLNGLALMLGGTDNWITLVLLTFVVHLPLAVVEGIILGFTVGFLARVKPQLLYGYRPPARRAPSPALASVQAEKIVALVFAPLVLLAFAGPALAHRLEAAYRVLPDKRVEIESWFDIPGDNGDTPRGAKVQVFHADGSLLTEGVMDSRGLFLFGFEKAESLRVVVNAGQGHAKELKIPKEELEKPTSPDSTTPDDSGGSATSVAQPFANRASTFQFRDVLIALAFIFGVAAFVLSVRNALTLRELRRRRGGPPGA
jgi:cobalt/nickel transport system permease protein